MKPGGGGDVPGVTLRVLTADVPQLFTAATVIAPEALPTVALMEAVEEVPPQPAGRVQL